jgi:hypothetical protein
MLKLYRIHHGLTGKMIVGYDKNPFRLLRHILDERSHGFKFFFLVEIVISLGTGTFLKPLRGISSMQPEVGR